MAKKSDLQVFVEMNEADTKNGTRNVVVCPTLVKANKTKAGTEVTMGADDAVLMQLMNGTHAALLVIVDLEEYKKYKNGKNN